MKQTENRENNYQYGFTLVELLVSISILATISIISYVSYAGHMKSVNNATRIETIDSLHLSLSDYYQQKKTLPEPNSNYISYDERGTYMHSSSGSYGISGYVSNDFLPKGYVNFRATDPESNQFYGYGKLTDNTSFDIAATLYDETTGGYKTYLRGTYPKQRLSSLIRAYSSSNFVSQDSTEDLPYNPYERKVSAYISSYSGTLSLTNSKGISTIFNSPLSFTGELNSGDTITVAMNSTALLHISDGSELSLGSTTSQTILSLNTLEYSDDNNLASRVALFLKSGEVWTEAPHLRMEADSNSDFSIKTDSALAAVRGTVFGVTRDASGTTFSLASGKLEVSKLDVVGVSTPFTTTQGFSTTATGGFVIADAKSYMVVPDGAQPIILTVPPLSSPATTPASTGSINQDAVKQKIQHPPFSLGYRPKADRISFSGATSTDKDSTLIKNGILTVIFQNPGADSYELSFGTGEVTDSTVFLGLNPNQILTGTLDTTQTLTTITGAFIYVKQDHLTRTYTLRVCSRGHCSAPDIKGLGGEIFAFENFRVWGEKRDGGSARAVTLPPPPPVCPNLNDPTQTNFWTNCLTDTNSGLVAFAPYNVAGDFSMYTGSTTHLFSESSDITSTGANSASGVLVPTGSSLKYNITPLALGNSFSIEMSVKGGMLRRPTGSYFLFDGTGISGEGLQLSMYYGNLSLGKHLNGCAGSSCRYQTISSTSLSLLNDNTFYKIRATYDVINGLKLIITDLNPLINPNPNISSSPTTTPPPSLYPRIDTLYVGNRYNNSLSSNTEQWNDIIDSVKIYKN